MSSLLQRMLNSYKCKVCNQFRHFFESKLCIQKDPSVIIIGAGAAGIAAATRLLENNFKNILILEAEPRIGGRINSVKFGDAYVDLGAEWCHGEENNIVHNLVKHLNILRSASFSGELYHSTKGILDNDFSRELMEIFDTIEAEDGSSEGDYYATVYGYGDFFMAKFYKIVYQKYGKNQEKLAVALSALEFFNNIVLTLQGAFSWFEPSIRCDFRGCEGDHNLSWNGLGFKTILEILMKKYPDSLNQLPIDNKFLLTKEVVNINWKGREKGVKILCADRSSYTADHVIVTASIGVLKEKGGTMFTPRLPNSKMEAIENIGIGGAIKVMLHFPKKWWKNSTGFNFLWSESDQMAATHEFTKGPNWEGRSWVTYFNMIATLEYNPNVLIGWFTGNLVPEIELLPEETFSNGIYYVLNKFLGHKYDITKHSEIIRSKWCSNPNFRGTYSFQTPKSKMAGGKSAEEILAMPIKDAGDRPVLQFAGEATHPYYYSTVHGAIETGHREADILINFYNKRY